MTDDEKRSGTGGDPAGGADPGGTRPAKPKGQGTVETDRSVQSGDRNDMTKSDPIKR